MPEPAPPTTEVPHEDRLARRALAGALAAELGHDLQGPLNLFRLMTDRLERGQPLDAEDAALLREELDRLSGLSARLRDLARLPLSRDVHSPRRLIEAALALTPALTGVELQLEGSEAVSVNVDGPLLSRAVRELLDNALEARRERAGARWEPGEPPCLCVWDDGEGFVAEPGQAARFGVTTHAGAAGLGLTLALRVARAHGFRLELSRAGGRTEARLWLSAFSRVERETGDAP